MKQGQRSGEGDRILSHVHLESYMNKEWVTGGESWACAAQRDTPALEKSFRLTSDNSANYCNYTMDTEQLL